MRTILWFGALALLASASSLHAGEADGSPRPQISVADFAALPILQKPILSPDGHWIAARATANGYTTLVILDADKPQTAARTINLGKTDIAAVTWAGNRRLLLTAWARQEVSGGLKFPILRLAAIDVATGALRLVDRKSRGVYAGDVLYTDPSGSWALVAGQDDIYSYPSVKRVDLASGEALTVEKERPEVWDWYADDQGVVRAGVAYEGRRWTIWYRDKPNEKLRPIRGKISKDEASAIDRFIFRGPNSWVVTNERTGRFGLYKYDVGTGASTEAIFEHPEVDLDDVLFDRFTGAVKAVQFEDDRARIRWLDPKMGALQAKLDQALPNSVNLPIDWSNDEKRVLVRSEGGSDPGRYFLLDRTTSKMHPVVDPYPRINPELLSEVRAVRYRARDGLSINGYLTLPRGRSAKKLPLVLMPHGGPFDRDHWEYDPIVQFLASRGYAVFQPQFRGSTGYGKDFVSKGYGEWGRKMQDDLDDGLDWLAGTGQIDPKRVCIVGASYGGYAAMWGAIRNPDRYRCAASMAGVSDVAALLRYDKKSFSATRYYREWRTRVGGEGKSDLRAISPLTYAAELKVPLLVGHGEQDGRVPGEQSRNMIKAVGKAKTEVISVFYKDSGHGFDTSADLQDWLERLEAFLRKYNPA